MKITRSQLKQLIKEELEVAMGEGFLDRLMGRKEVDNQTLMYVGPHQIEVKLDKSGDIDHSVGLGKNPVGLSLAAIVGGKVKLATPKGQSPEDKLKPSSASVNIRYKVNPAWEHDFNPLAIAKGKGVPPRIDLHGPVNANKDVEYLAKQLERLNADGFMADYDGPGGFENVDAPELAKRIYLDFIKKSHTIAKRPDQEIALHLDSAKKQLGI